MSDFHLETLSDSEVYYVVDIAMHCTYVHIRCPEGSTNKGYPGCFYILQNFINVYGTTLFFSGPQYSCNSEVATFWISLIG